MATTPYRPGLPPRPAALVLNNRSWQARGLIAAWPVTAGIVHDLGDLKKHGTITSPGAIDRGTPTFNATSTYVDCGTHAALDLPRPFTIVAVVNRTTNSSYQGIIAKRSGLAGWWLTAFPQKVTISIDANDLASPDSSTTGFPDGNGDTVIVASCTKAGRFLYINGRLAASDAYTADPTPHGVSAEIGREVSVYFGGLIYDVRLYRVAWSEADVSRHFVSPWELYNVGRDSLIFNKSSVVYSQSYSDIIKMREPSTIRGYDVYLPDVVNFKEQYGYDTGSRAEKIKLVESKTFAQSGGTAVTRNSTEYIKLVEATNKLIAHKAGDIFKLSDSAKKQLTKTIKDIVKLGDLVYKDRCKSINDKILLLDSLHKDFCKQAMDKILLKDSILTIKNSLRSLSDKIKLSDQLVLIKAMSNLQTDIIKLRDNQHFDLYKTIYEIIKIKEQITVAGRFNKSISDVVKMIDSPQFKKTHSVTDKILIKDTTATIKDKSTYLSDMIKMIETTKFAKTKSFKEMVKMVEIVTLSRTGNVSITINEIIKMVEKMYFSKCKAAFDIVKIRETINKQLNKAITDKINIRENIYLYKTKNIIEKIYIKEIFALSKSRR